MAQRRVHTVLLPSRRELCTFAFCGILLLQLGTGQFLNPAFSSLMVLQRAPRSSRFFGKAPPGARVEVVLAPTLPHGEDGAMAHAQAGIDGYWLAALPPQAASNNRTITIRLASGAGARLDRAVNPVVLTEVAFGEVFLCGGQVRLTCIHAHTHAHAYTQCTRTQCTHMHAHTRSSVIVLFCGRVLIHSMTNVVSFKWCNIICLI